MNKNNFSFELKMQDQEAKVRGIYLCVACDFERIMEHIILACEIDNKDDREAFRVKKLSHLTMGGKLGRFKKTVRKYNKEYFDSYNSVMKSIKKLIHYRNMLAHGLASYDENKADYSYIIFDWVVSGNLKAKRY